MSGCCRPGGFVPPAKLAALDLLRSAGVALPDGAQIWGPRDGLSWRLVDRYGRDPADGPLGSPHPLRTLEGLDAGDVTVVAERRGRVLRIVGG